MKTYMSLCSLVVWLVGNSALSAAEPMSTEKLNTLESKLVGSWMGRSACAGNLVFQADRTYHHVDFGPGGGMFEVGTWKLEVAELPPTLVLTSFPTEATAEDENKVSRVYLLRLNDNELNFRWSNPNNSIMYKHQRGTEHDNVAIRIAILDHAVQRYLGHEKYGAGVNLPANLKTLVDRNILHSTASLLDPWGNEFQYDVTGRKTKNAQVPDIWTVSPEKQVIDNWSNRN